MIAIMDIEKLRTLYQDDAAARLLLNRWSQRQRRASVSEVGALLRDPQVKDARLERGDIVRVLRALESCECGRFVTGRRGRDSRFMWRDDCIRVGQASIDVSGDPNATPAEGDVHAASKGAALNDPNLRGTSEGEPRQPRPGHQRIVVSYRDGKDHGLPKSKAFVGKWILPPEEPVCYRDESGQVDSSYCVAITAKKNIVVYAWDTDSDRARFNEYFWVFNSFDQAAAADEMISAAITAAIERMGVEVEELDI